MNTSNNSLAEHLEKLARDMEYPPLNGGPTQEEIISALKASAEIIGEYEHDEDMMEDLEDFAAAAQDETEKFKSIIADITDQLDSVLLDMMKASRSGLITGVTVGTIMDRLLNIIGDYRRA